MSISSEAKILKNLFKNTKLRLTKPRRLIFEELAKLKKHVDAEEFLKILHKKGHNVSRSTVYRNLDFLVEKKFENIDTKSIYYALKFIGKFLEKNILIPNNLNYPMPRKNLESCFK